MPAKSSLDPSEWELACAYVSLQLRAHLSSYPCLVVIFRHVSACSSYLLSIGLSETGVEVVSFVKFTAGCPRANFSASKAICICCLMTTSFLDNSQQACAQQTLTDAYQSEHQRICWLIVRLLFVALPAPARLVLSVAAS